MTELRAFLTALYDDVSEAELAALQHSQSRLATLLEAGAIPPDIAIPVYHASEVEVTLDVRIEAEPTNDGLRLTVGEGPPDDASTLRLQLDLFELIDEGDLDQLDGTGPPSGGTLDPRGLPASAVHGIGPTYAQRLQEHDIETIGDLLELSPEDLADAVSGERIDVSPETVEAWLEAARGLLAVLPDIEADQPVELVDGIGPTFGRRLREHGVITLSDLLQRSPESIAELISTEELTISPQQATGWLEQAEHLLRTGGEAGGPDEANRPAGIDEAERTNDDGATRSDNTNDEEPIDPTEDANQ